MPHFSDSSKPTLGNMGKPNNFSSTSLLFATVCLSHTIRHDRAQEVFKACSCNLTTP